MADHRKMAVWLKSMDLVEEIYKLTKHLPGNEAYGLISQTTRAAVSIPSNVAEGYRRGTKNEFHHFLSIAYGSAAELETQLEIIRRVYPDKTSSMQNADGLLGEVMRLLHTMTKNTKPPLIS
jgi:four helix bundle protein